MSAQDDVKAAVEAFKAQTAANVNAVAILSPLVDKVATIGNIDTSELIAAVTANTESQTAVSDTITKVAAAVDAKVTP